jgi:hypothetical protein
MIIFGSYFIEGSNFSMFWGLIFSTRGLILFKLMHKNALNSLLPQTSITTSSHHKENASKAPITGA